RRDKIASEKLIQQQLIGSQFHEHPVFPIRKLHGYEPIVLAFEVAHAGKIRCAFQLTCEGVSPTVIWTTKMRGLALGFRHYCRCMMAADIEERASCLVVVTYDHDRLVADICCYVVPRVRQLVASSSEVP